jgi:hypothetical protein
LAVERKTIENRIGMINHFPKTKNTKRSKKKYIHAIVDITKLVYNKEILLQNREILIEIYRYPETITILAIDWRTSETFRLIIDYYEALGIMGGTENWKVLTACLSLEGNDCLVLIYP